MEIGKQEYPKFTVIIPQKNRAEYLGYTLQTCMAQDYPNFEVVVSDDCSDDNSVEVIKSKAEIDSRIKLYAHSNHLGMRDNFEFALNQVKSGFVIALGGDDGLVPGAIWKMYNIIQETGTSLLTWSTAGFTYPDETSKENIFWVKRKKGKDIKFIKSKEFFKKLTQTFIYQIDECPMFYMKGAASIDLVNKVKGRTPDGCFYYCPTPDGFSGVVLAGEVEEFAYTAEPLSIVGNTTKSQGRNYYRTDKESRKEAQEFFNDNIRRTMHSQLASQQYSPLEPLMTADYLLTAKDLPGWPGEVEEIDFEHLIRTCFKFIETAPYATEVLVRELKIIREIAKQHDLLDLFNNLYKTTKKKVSTTSSIRGFVITHSIRFEGTKLGINNIYDAANAVNFVWSFNNRFSRKEVGQFLKNMYRIFSNKRKYKLENLPILD